MILRFVSILAVLAITTGIAALWSLSLGHSDVTPTQTLRMLFDPASDPAGQMLFQTRLPRVLTALLTGAALAMSGALIQGLTGNALADPGLVGINAGAAFTMVAGMSFLAIETPAMLIALALPGAAATAGLVALLGASGRAPRSERLILSGLTMALLLGALTTAVLRVTEAPPQDLVFWTLGDLSRQQMPALLDVMPVALGLLIAALALSHRILPPQTSPLTAPPQSQSHWRLIGAALAIALATASVALAGPLSFVGLLAPRLARRLLSTTGPLVLPPAALAGATLTVLAEALPEALGQRDLPPGISLGLLGAPLLIWGILSAKGGVQRGARP